MVETVVELPESMRSALKEPLGPLFTDPTALMESVDGPLIAVGDVVTYHFETIGVTPDLALVDGRTKREAVADRVTETVDRSGATRVDVENPAGALSHDLLTAIRDALDDEAATVLVVDGEEDLAVLPAIVAAPAGASVVYGQPDEGMVHVVVTDETRAHVRELLERMDGDHERLFALLDAE